MVIAICITFCQILPALAAAAFLRGRAPGLYDMRHIIGKENGT